MWYCLQVFGFELRQRRMFFKFLLLFCKFFIVLLNQIWRFISSLFKLFSKFSTNLKFFEKEKKNSKPRQFENLVNSNFGASPLQFELARFGWSLHLAAAPQGIGRRTPLLITQISQNNGKINEYLRRVEISTDLAQMQQKVHAATYATSIAPLCLSSRSNVLK